MDKRVNKKLVAFQFSFVIDDIEKRFPAGTYTVETEEETILGSSFQAYRHIETILVKRPPKGKPGLSHYWSVDHEALARAIEADSDRFHEFGRSTASARTTSNKETGSE